MQVAAIQKSSITGLYVLGFYSNDRKGTDTIVITPLNEKAHVYYFVHHIDIQKLLKGNLVSEEHKTNSSLWAYIVDKGQIKNQIYGKFLKQIRA